MQLQHRSRKNFGNSKISIFIAASLIGACLLFTSCKKDASKDSDVESAQDDALAETSFNDVTTISDQAALGGSVGLRVAGDATANREDGSPVMAPEDGYIILPNPNTPPQTEWFYFGKKASL